MKTKNTIRPNAIGMAHFASIAPKSAPRARSTSLKTRRTNTSGASTSEATKNLDFSHLATASTGGAERAVSKSAPQAVGGMDRALAALNPMTRAAAAKPPAGEKRSLPVAGSVGSIWDRAFSKVNVGAGRGWSAAFSKAGKARTAGPGRS